MKTNKVTKLGVSLLSVAALGVVAPALTNAPVFGASVVKAEETRPLEYRIVYYDKDTREEIAPPKTGTINPGEIVNIYKDIDGYQVVSNFDEWMPGFNASYRIMSEYFGFSNGRLFMYLDYKRLTPTPTPEPAPTPGKDKDKENPKPEVKPSEKPEAEAKEQEPIKYRIRYLDEHSREIAPMYTGVLNPGESVNIYKDIEGHQVVSNFSWMPGYNLTYNIASTYFYGAKDGYLEGYLRYKKLDPTPTPKPEVKPEPAPKEEEKQEPLKYRITYYDSEARKILGQMTGTINPGETINIYKHFDGYEIVSKDEWMPNYILTWDIVNRFFYGSADGYDDLYLYYKKLDPTPTPTPEPEVKPAPKPSDTSKPKVKPELKPQTNSNTAPTAPVKPVGQTSNSKADKPTAKKETPALPNTGEQSSSLSLVGLLLASLGLAGLTYKGRH